MKFRKLTSKLEFISGESNLSTNVLIKSQTGPVILYELIMVLPQLPAFAFVITFDIDMNQLKIEFDSQLSSDKSAVVDEEGFKRLVESKTDSVLELIKEYSNRPTDYKALAELYIQNRGVVSGARFNF